MQSVSKGLVIDQPWIDLILSGKKTWEMRSTGASHRGWFGLIRKGSGTVCGVAQIESVGAALTPDEMVSTIDKHQIPEAMIRSGAVAKWNTPWTLTKVIRLARPVPYHHPSGAVTWVSLDAATSQAITAQMQGAPILPTLEARPNSVPVTSKPVRPVPAVPAAPLDSSMPARQATLMGESDVTQGNLTHNHFYMRGFVHRFPGDLIGGCNIHSAAPRTAVVDWGGTVTVETDIDGDKKFFRKRGWIKQFFADNDAAPGDRVRVVQTAPYRYRVTLVKGAA